MCQKHDTSVVSTCNLTDLATNKHSANPIAKNLDRILVNCSWMHHSCSLTRVLRHQGSLTMLVSGFILNLLLRVTSVPQFFYFLVDHPDFETLYLYHFHQQLKMLTPFRRVLNRNKFCNILQRTREVYVAYCIRNRSRHSSVILLSHLRSCLRRLFTGINGLQQRIYFTVKNLYYLVEVW